MTKYAGLWPIARPDVRGLAQFIVLAAVLFLSVDPADAQFKGGAPSIAPAPSTVPRLTAPPPKIAVPNKSTSKAGAKQQETKKSVKKVAPSKSKSASPASEPTKKIAVKKPDKTERPTPKKVEPKKSASRNGAPKSAKKTKQSGQGAAEYVAAPDFGDDANAQAADFPGGSFTGALAVLNLPGLALPLFSADTLAVAESAAGCGEFCGPISLTFPDEGGGVGPPACEFCAVDVPSFPDASSWSVMAPAVADGLALPPGPGGDPFGVLGPGFGDPPVAPAAAGAAASLRAAGTGGQDLCAFVQATGDDHDRRGGEVSGSGRQHASVRALCALAQLPDERRSARDQALTASQAMTTMTATGAPVRLAALPSPLTRSDAAPGAVLTVDGEVRPGEVVVSLAPTATLADEAALGRDYDLEAIETHQSELTGRRIVLYRLRGSRPLSEVLAALSLDARVIAVQPNQIFRVIGAASARLAMPQYAPDTIRVREAHEFAKGRRVVVAVIDTAIDTAHRELAGAILKSFNAVGAGQARPAEHGTAIAGVLAARAEMLGIAPEAQLLGVTAFAEDSKGIPHSTSFVLVKAVDWAHANGAQVLNMSFAGPHDHLLEAVIEAALRNGTTIVAAAGNGGPGAKSAYPAAIAGVIAVSATDAEDRLYSEANRGDYICIAAPGVDILTPGLRQSYALQSGTSIAAAHVAGVAALLLEREPSLRSDDVRRLLTGSARTPVKPLTPAEIGAGIIDAAGAVQAATGSGVR